MRASAKIAERLAPGSCSEHTEGMTTTSSGAGFRLGIGIAAIFAGSLIAGCCGGPLSAEGGCTGCSDDDCVPPDAAADAPSDAPAD